MKTLLLLGVLALGIAFLINLFPWFDYASSGDDSSLLPIVSVVIAALITLLMGCFSLLEGVTGRASWSLDDDTIRYGLRRFVQTWVIALGLCLGMILGIFTVHRIRTDIYTRAIVAAEPILRALMKYEAEHGHGPKALVQLVPDYLRAIPACGFVGKDFVYDQCPTFCAEDELVGWQLSVDFRGIWLINRLHFNSTAVYPERTTRIGDWGLTLYR